MGKPFDTASFLATFLAEAKEHLATLNAGLLRLEKDPKQPELIEALLRAAHTLKGAARMMGYLDIQQVAHRLEDLFQQIGDGRIMVTAAFITQALKALDVIETLVDAVVQGKTATTDVSAVCQALDAAVGKTPPGALDGMAEPSSPIRKDVAPSVSTQAKLAAQEGALRRVEESIRIPIGRINTLMNLAGELVIHRVKSSHKLLALRRLSQAVKASEHHLSQLGESVGDPVRGSSGADGKASSLLHQCQVDVDRLKREIVDLSDHLSDEVAHLDPVIDELQFKVKELRMLPCATIFEGFERLVRDVAQQEQKEAALIIQGAETELDKQVLEAVRPCLIHILRNAVSHGIEPPQERAASGKPKAGAIHLEALQESGRVVIRVQDDGRGIDVERIKAVVLKRRLATERQLADMGESELINFIFAPGFSTSPIITEVSGRGVGLDVVRQEVERLKGRIRVDSRIGQGTMMTVELPLAVAIVQALLVRANDRMFGVPLLSVEETVAVASKDIRTIEGHMAIALRERTVPIVKLAATLGLPAVAAGKPAAAFGEERWPVIIANSLDQRVGFLVDEILGEEEIFIKSLGRHLGKVPNVSGAAILGTGEVIVVLDVPELMRSAQLTHPAAAGAAHPEKKQPHLLIVEDSLTVREVERSILEAKGYAVETAVDGLDALEKLRLQPFDLIVSDVQMPRMDGFELCRTLRQRPEYKEVPLIFVTALEQEEEKRRGIEVGAQAYIVKRTFDQANLLDAIERLIG